METIALCAGNVMFPIVPNPQFPKSLRSIHKIELDTNYGYFTLTICCLGFLISYLAKITLSHRKIYIQVALKLLYKKNG